MRSLVFFLASFLLFSETGSAAAASGALPQVKDVYAQFTLPDRPAAIYLTLQGADQEDRLIAASTPLASRVEIHQMKASGAIMTMVKLDGLPVAKGQKVILAPGGTHLMVFGLKSLPKVGTQFPLTLSFAKSGTLTLQVPVLAYGQAPKAYSKK